MKKILWHVIAGTRGGEKRVRIIRALSERPHNANQLAERLDICYNTVRHHLEILEEHNIVTPGVKEYGKLYHLTDQFEQHRDEFERITSEMTVSRTSSRDVSSNGP
jgi:predicted ArsR family transcriptional regulator